MQVQEIMNKNVVTVAPDATVSDSAKKMVEKGTKFLIITKGSQIIFVVIKH